MALRGALRIRGGSTRRWTACPAALVRANADHEVDARGTRTLVGFFDPQSALGQGLAARIDRDIAIVPTGEVAAWRATLTHGAPPGELRALRWMDELLDRKSSPVRMHPGVRRAIRHLQEHLGAGDDVSLSALARVAGLSPSRFMHAFTENAQVPLRPYVLWLRLQRAMGSLLSGTTIALTARRVGFSDASHMTRTFRRMLGTTPREVVERRHAASGISVET